MEVSSSEARNCPHAAPEGEGSTSDFTAEGPAFDSLGFAAPLDAQEAAEAAITIKVIVALESLFISLPNSVFSSIAVTPSGSEPEGRDTIGFAYGPCFVDIFAAFANATLSQP